MATRHEKKKKVHAYQKKKSIPELKIIEELQARYESIDETKIKKFADFPLSSKTLQGLSEYKFIEPTDIQRQSIGLALVGNDILGAAKTGSGKTLAFLIPILEKLYCLRWSRLDGIGALVITPTRELAYQIHETLRKVGKYHDMTTCLLIGGQNLDFEQKHLHKQNIIIGTPGRILQHMDQNPLFDCISMKILVLDEADRCLDMGFEASMNAIIENLPPERQTLLFSATQTRSVKDLARLSLKDPMYVSVHEHAKHVTPEGLQQSYVICNLEDKIAMLWSFIKHHREQKIIVFFSSCKQVKYVYEIFSKMRAGKSLLALYSTIRQLRRTKIYEDFCRKQNVVLFATDIASRGLDFPAVHWVVQMDCPEDTNAYIHRAGRTARFQQNGESLLVLLPSEAKMVDKLIERKIPINEIRINPRQLHSPHRHLEALLARNIELKESAQRAFVAYVKSVFLMKDKEIFDVHALDTNAFARSLGLPIPPRIRFLQRMQKKMDKNEQDCGKSNKSDDEDNLTKKMLKNQTLSNNDYSDNNSDENEENQEKFRNNEKKSLTFNDRKANFSGGFKFFDDNDSSDDENILTIKRKNIQIRDDYPEKSANNQNDETISSKKNKKTVTKVAVAKKILRQKIVANKKIQFDHEGNELIDPTKSKVSDLGKQYENVESSGINIEEVKEILREEDKFDKKRFRARINEKHREEKRKLKEKKKKPESDEEQEYEKYQVRLGHNSESESDAGSEEGGSDLSSIPDDDNNDDINNEGESESENDEQIHRPPKRELYIQNNYKKKKRRIGLPENTDLTVAEEMALQLLKNK